MYMAKSIVPPKRLPIHKAINPAEDEILRRLRSYLDGASPKLVYFLVNNTRAQGRAITYKELRTAILNGEISERDLAEWYDDYSRFVVKYMTPAWEDAMKAANEGREARYPDWYFNPAAEGVRRWTANHSAELVTSVTQTQIEGLRAVVRSAATLNNMGVDQLARAIRPMVGLTAPQAKANLKYYNTLIENGIKEEKALDLSVRYSARQNRYRASSIARTELAMAYNEGADEGVRQAIEKGYMSRVEKIWCTSMIEARRCPACKSLEGARIAMDGEFVTQVSKNRRVTKKLPPLHPNCMCSVLYEEVDEDDLN